MLILLACRKFQKNVTWETRWWPCACSDATVNANCILWDRKLFSRSCTLSYIGVSIVLSPRTGNPSCMIFFPGAIIGYAWLLPIEGWHVLHFPGEYAVPYMCTIALPHCHHCHIARIEFGTHAVVHALQHSLQMCNLFPLLMHSKIVKKKNLQKMLDSLLHIRLNCVILIHI